jgi:hypothetical protein
MGELIKEEPWAGFNTIPPDEQGQQATDPATVTDSQAGTTTEGVPPVTSDAQGQTAEPPKVDEPKPDSFFEEFNKRYSTQFKADDEIKNLVSLIGKVSDYEGKLKDYDSLKTSVDKYKKEAEDTRSNVMSEFLTKQRVKKAFIAEQLIEKYPDRDPDILSELAMSDVDKMSDLEVLARERKMRGSKSTLDNIKAVIMKEIGADPTTRPEEWDSMVTTELELKATDARDRIKQLLSGVEIPKIVTKEERQAMMAKALEDKSNAIKPIQQVFEKFETFKVGDTDFVVPDEFKSKLPDIFKGMFIDGGLEVNEENIATAELIKKALFVEEYLPKMLELHEKQVRTKVKEETDKLLHNDQPPNTTIATDQAPQGTGNPSLEDFFRTKDETVRKL